MSDSSREAHEQIEVWRFRRFDVRRGQYVTSIGKAEVATIQGFGAEVIPGSMESVPQHKLDGNRIYTPPTAPMSSVARRRLERLRDSRLFDRLQAAVELGVERLRPEDEPEQLHLVEPVVDVTG